MFEITRKLNHTIVSIGKFKIKIRDFGIPKNFYKYINKYKYVLETVKKEEVSTEYKDTIWQFWYQGEESVPPIVKKCMDSIKFFHPEKNIVLITEKNIKEFIDIPQYMLDKIENNQFPITQFSDYLRACLLIKYGGVWIDATILLTDRIPEKIFNENFFVFKSLEWKNMININKNKKPANFSSWFVVSKPNNKILIAAKRFFEEYWKKEKKVKEYYMFHYFILFYVMNNCEMLQLWCNSLFVRNDIQFLLQHIFPQEFLEEKFEEIISKTPIHKLTYKNLNDFNQKWIEKILNLNFETTKGFFTDFDNE